MNAERLLFPECFHLLVAAGNDNLRSSLVESLAPAGYRIEVVTDEGEAIDVVRHSRVDLVLLGLNPPETSGIEACRKLRALEPRLRIVMVGEKERPDNERIALDAGADDCIAAPFRFREIVARLSAVLRLVRGTRLLRRAGREVHLSPREFDLLEFLMKNPERAFTHVKLLRALWGAEESYGVENLRPQINGLRRKIENDPSNPEYILTEPWVGYRFHNPGRRYRRESSF